VKAALCSAQLSTLIYCALRAGRCHQGRKPSPQYHRDTVLKGQYWPQRLREHSEQILMTRHVQRPAYYYECHPVAICMRRRTHCAVRLSTGTHRAGVCAAASEAGATVYADRSPSVGRVLLKEHKEVGEGGQGMQQQVRLHVKHHCQQNNSYY
jgi:hypothetical protein